MRIAIVDNLEPAMQAIRRTLATVPEYEVVWIADNGLEAVERCAQDTPDLIIMDLVMPEMDGAEATRQIMQQSPCAVLVTSASVGDRAGKAFEAMGAGALDAVNTPSIGADGELVGADRLLDKIATLSKLIRHGDGISRTRIASIRKKRPAEPPMVVIGSSTGGPMALATVLSVLPADFGASVVIVQHVDEEFSAGLATWLNSRTELEVGVARRGDRPTVGSVLLASTHDHLILTPEPTLDYTPHPRNLAYRPSVDVFFRSVAHHWHTRGTAVLLTGMGRDGAEGLLALKSAGWHTIAQDEATSVVYGMPKAAAEIGAARNVMPLEDIGHAISRHHLRTRVSTT